MAHLIETQKVEMMTWMIEMDGGHLMPLLYRSKTIHLESLLVITEVRTFELQFMSDAIDGFYLSYCYRTTFL